MKRTAYNDLLAWKRNEFHKPLLVIGARKVGKTYLLKEFAKAQYEKVIYFSFDQNPGLKDLFVNEPEAHRILREISSLSKIDVTPGNTLIILDDVQYCPGALDIIPDFVESAFGFDIVMAGFLAASPKAEARRDELLRFGSVEQLRIFPFSFGEFLMALGKDNMAGLLDSKDWGAIDSLLPRYNELLKEYLFCGGMPQVVAAFAEGQQPGAIRAIQKDLLEGIDNDILRFAPKRHIDEISAVWKAAPGSLLAENKKFKLAALKPGARLKDYESSFDWLVRAGLIYKVHRLSTVSQPVEFFQDRKCFRLYPLDPGLWAAILDIDPVRILVGDEALYGFSLALLHVFVAGQIASVGAPACFYGARGSTLEVDFIAQKPSRLVPVEIMPRPNGNSKALKLFTETHPGRNGIRASLENYFDRGWMENLPVYSVAGYLSDVA